MIRIKRVKRIAVAVKDLDGAVDNWKRMFGIKPFQRGEEPQDRYAFVAFQIGNTRGDGEMTIEFLSPINDPNGEMLIGKFIKNKGEGLYMITLETEGTSGEVDREIKETGLEPSWGGQLKQWKGTEGMEEIGLKSWTEHYVNPKNANGVLITLASIEYADPKVVHGKPGKTIDVKK
jgi:hypothetical protein